jgi:metallo-beta-lactamase class B
MNRFSAGLLSVTVVLGSVSHAQQPKVWTQEELFRRNVGSPEDQNAQFPPHKIIGNVYYVGTKSLASFLVTTPQGNILINTSYERTVPVIKDSVEKLGFRFTDTKIILGSHAHGDHMEGDALAKQLSGGAQVMAMAEDVPALSAMRPGGKAHPIDRTLKDGEQITLGGTTVIAHLTAGHTRGCTTWTTRVQDGERPLDVVFACSYRAPAPVTPAIEGEFNRTFSTIRQLPCDVPLGDHPAQYRMAEKHARLKPGAPNPFVDPGGCWLEAEIQEAMLRAQLRLQK